jgi:uncharacterized protein
MKKARGIGIMPSVRRECFPIPERLTGAQISLPGRGVVIMNVTRREFSQMLAYAAATTSVARAKGSYSVEDGEKPKTNIRLQSFNYSGVRLLDGMQLRQFQLTRDTYYNISNDSLLFGFRQRAGLPAPGKSLDGWYGSDIFNTFGQFLAGMARMSKATNDPPMREKAVFLMNEWGKTIAPDGYFFYSVHPNVYHYTYEKTIGGLNDIYEYTGAKEALVYLDRITDWAIKNLDRSQVTLPPLKASAGGDEWYTLSENLYRAYLNTGDPKYKKFAEVWHYDKYWIPYAEGSPDADFLHAYSHVNTLSSAAMAYRVSGNLTAIMNAYRYLQLTQFFATGGYGPREKLLPPDGSLGASLEARTDTFETPCGSWAGFKLSRYLMSFTGKAEYGDWIERLAYNGIGAALPVKESGSTFYYSDYGLSGSTKVYHEETHGGETWPCCSGTFPQAVADYHNIIYFKDQDGLYVNLYVPSEVTWDRHEETVVVRQETSYPESATVVLTVTPQKTSAFPLYFRIPGWARGEITATINGTAEPITAKPGTWAKIHRSWKPGDRIELQLPLEFVLVPVDSQHPKRVAVTRGPVVWVRQGQPTPAMNFSQWKKDGNGPMAFAVNMPSEGRFVPFYRLGRHEPYLMYFDV